MGPITGERTAPADLMRRLRRLGLLNTPRHQGKSECARRLRQIANGQLRGPVVTDEARYAAHGLVAPSGEQLVILAK
jgi:hypothetical protein